MSLSKFTKGLVGGTLTTTGGAGTVYYVTKDTPKHYAIEKEIIKNDVTFDVTVGEKNTDTLIKLSWKKEDQEENKWECTIKKPLKFQINKSSFKTNLSSFLRIDPQKTQKIRQQLIDVCAKGRTEDSNDQKVVSEFLFPSKEPVVDNLVWMLIWNYGNNTTDPSSSSTPAA